MVPGRIGISLLCALALRTSLYTSVSLHMTVCVCDVHLLALSHRVVHPSVLLDYELVECREDARSSLHP